MKKIFNSKILLMLVLLVALCTILTSCVSTGAQTVKITDVDGTGSELTTDQLNAIATLVRNNKNAWSDFVAAYRGYDVLGDDANLSEVCG